MLSSALLNVPGSKGACTIVTETLVDSNDPAFANPTKPVRLGRSTVTRERETHEDSVRR